MSEPESTSTPMLCTSCGRRGRGVYRQPQCSSLEIALWLCGGVPGLIYSAWRRSPKRRRAVCKRCALATLVPLASPDAQRVLARQEKRDGPKHGLSPDLGVPVDWSPTPLPPVRPYVPDSAPMPLDLAVPPAAAREMGNPYRIF